MKRWVLFGIALLAGLGTLLWVRVRISREAGEVFRAPAHPPEPAPLCPWREPEQDMARFFPCADHFEAQPRILSGRFVELAKSLGRTPAPEELFIRLYRIFRGRQAVGTVLVRRVKGEFGALELVLAVGLDGQVRGLGLQRLREPPTVAAALQDPAWLASFTGKSASNCWRLGEGIPSVRDEAAASAQTLIEGVRAALILLSAAETAPQPSESDGRSNGLAHH